MDVGFLSVCCTPPCVPVRTVNSWSPTFAPQRESKILRPVFKNARRVFSGNSLRVTWRGRRQLTASASSSGSEHEFEFAEVVFKSIDCITDLSTEHRLISTDLDVSAPSKTLVATNHTDSSKM